MLPAKLKRQNFQFKWGVERLKWDNLEQSRWAATCGAWEGTTNFRPPMINEVESGKATSLLRFWPRGTAEGLNVRRNAFVHGRRSTAIMNLLANISLDRGSLEPTLDHENGLTTKMREIVDHIKLVNKKRISMNSSQES